MLPTGPGAANSRPAPSEISTTLVVDAATAYEIFADAPDVPRWLPLVQSARTLARYPDGRPHLVAFTRTFERGFLRYTLAYRYDPARLVIDWTTPDSSNVVLIGSASFIALSERACLMHYALALALPIIDDLMRCELDHHAASHVVAAFRDHLRQL